MSELTLGRHVSTAVAALMTPEFIEKEVETRLAKLVTESIDRALRSYSDTGKMIEKAVEDALRVDRIDLPAYGETVANILKAQIESRVADLVAGRLSEDMAELLSLAPKEVRLSEIAASMLEECSEDYGELITAYAEMTSYGCQMIYLDEHEHYPDHRAKLEADIKIHLGGDGKILSATFRGASLKDHRNFGRAFGLEQKIRAYYACGTVIILDPDEVSICKGDH